MTRCILTCTFVLVHLATYSFLIMPKSTDSEPSPMPAKPPVVLDDFTECATKNGWRHLYAPRKSNAVALRSRGDGLSGIKSGERFVVVYGWAVVSTFEIPPSSKKRISMKCISENQSNYVFISDEMSDYTIHFSAKPARGNNSPEESGGSILIETKDNEKQLIAIIQQTISFHSSNLPFSVFKTGYVDTFGYSTYAKEK